MKRACIAALLFLFACSPAGPTTIAQVKVAYRKNPHSDRALFRFETGGKIGFIDSQGKVVIAPQFAPDWSGQDDFVEGLCPVRTFSAKRYEQRVGYIDDQGKWVIRPRFWHAERFSDGLALVTFLEPRRRDLYIDKSGQTVLEVPEGASAGNFSEGLASFSVYRNAPEGYGPAGYIDRTGKIAIAPQFAKAGEFQDGVARVVQDGKCEVLDTGYPATGARGINPLGFVLPGPGSPKLDPCREGFIDRQGRVIGWYFAAKPMTEGLAAVLVAGGKWGFIDKTGRFAIPAQFEEADRFSEGLAPAKLNRKWGFVDRTGRFVIPPEFAAVRPFSHGLAYADGGFIDRSGKRVIGREASDFVFGLAHVTLGPKRFGYMDRTGRIVFRYSDPDAGKAR